MTDDYQLAMHPRAHAHAQFGADACRRAWLLRELRSLGLEGAALEAAVELTTRELEILTHQFLRLRPGTTRFDVGALRPHLLADGVSAAEAEQLWVWGATERFLTVRLRSGHFRWVPMNHTLWTLVLQPSATPTSRGHV
jgi:hypothetical protein